MDITQMIALVEAYINHRANKQVHINPVGINLILLLKAYEHATQWFQENNGRVELIVS